MDWFQAGHLMFQDTLDLFNTGYDVYQDQRDTKFRNKVFDYQKDLQQNIFNREDTALQRRMADAEKAGLNPFSVANGSGAGAGSVVGTSGASAAHNVRSTNLLGNYGAYLDAMNAIEQNKQIKEQTRILQQENEIKNTERMQAKRLNTVNEITTLLDRGIPAKNIYFDFSRNEEGALSWTTDNNYIPGKNEVRLTDTNIWKRYQWTLENDKNISDSLKYKSFSDYYLMKGDEYNYDWLQFDRNYQRVLAGLRGVGDVLHGGSHAVEAINSVRDVNGRNALRDSQIMVNEKKSQPTRTTKTRTYSNGSGYTERSYSTK